MASARIFTACKPIRREAHLERSGHMRKEGCPDPKDKAQVPHCGLETQTVVSVTSPRGHSSTTSVPMTQGCYCHHEKGGGVLGTIEIKARSSRPRSRLDVQWWFLTRGDSASGRCLETLTVTRAECGGCRGGMCACYRHLAGGSQRCRLTSCSAQPHPKHGISGPKRQQCCC